MKLSTTSSVTLSTLIDGGETMPWPITFLFFMAHMFLALNRAIFNRLQLLCVGRHVPSVGILKAYDSIMEKNMLNSVGARTHPWFTPLRISNGSDVAPSYMTVPFMLLWSRSSHSVVPGTANFLQ